MSRRHSGLGGTRSLWRRKKRQKNNYERETISNEVVGAQPTLLVTEDIGEKAVDMATLDKHPAEGGEKEIVESERHSRAEERWLSGIEPSEEEEVGEGRVSIFDFEIF